MATAKKAVPASNVKTAVSGKQVVRVAPVNKLPEYSIKVEYDTDNGDDEACVTITHSSGKSYGADFTVSEEHLNASCGIYDLEGVTEFQNLYTQMAVIFPTAEKRKAVLKEALIQAFAHIKAERSAAFLVLSNNNKVLVINDILDEICVACTDYRKNPNSGSTIRAWFA